MASKSISQSILLPTLDGNGNKIIDVNNSSKYVLEEIENESGNVLPRFIFIIYF